MAFQHSKDAYFTITDSGGTARDLSDFLNDVSFSQPIETSETTTFGAASFKKTYIRGLTDSTLSVSGLFDPTATTGPDTVLNGLTTSTGSATSTFIYGPYGSATGNVKYTGECIITSYELSGSVGDAISFSSDFQCSGAITRTTF